MEAIAKERVVVFTPNGFLQQHEYDNNPKQVHKSGWYVDEMRNKGYRIIGIDGWKGLRGEYSKIRFWPERLWTTISDITQLFTRNHPEYAFEILCVKDKRRS